MDLSARPPCKQVRICFVGDSFVNGTGDPECLGWTGRICAAAQREGHDLTYYNLGVRRDTTADIVRRWGEEVARRLPADCDGRVVFSFGVNDTALEQGCQRVNFATSLSNARTILQTAQVRYPTLVVGPPPMPDLEHTRRIGAFSHGLAHLCDELALPYLETCVPLQASDDWAREVIANDGAHPRAAGYAALANLVQHWARWRGWFS